MGNGVVRKPGRVTAVTGGVSRLSLGRGGVPSSRTKTELMTPQSLSANLLFVLVP